MKIIYDDEDVIAVNKPPGMVVINEETSKDTHHSSLSVLLTQEFPQTKGVGNSRNGAVHRLDKDTSGVVLFAKNNNAFAFLQEEFFNQRVQKKYVALVSKVVKKDKGEIKTFIGRSPKDRRKQKAFTTGKREAVTLFKVIKRFAHYSLVIAYPKTGRKHQLRCHFAHIGHPICGDNLYRFKDQIDPPRLNRQFLHALSLTIKTPKGEVKKFIAPLPKDLKNILKTINKE